MVGWRWGGGGFPGQWSLLGVATACPGFVLFSWCESFGGEGEFGMTAATTAQVSSGSNLLVGAFSFTSKTASYMLQTCNKNLPLV